MATHQVLIDARLPWGSGIGRYVRNVVPVVAGHLPKVDFTLLVPENDVARATGCVALCPNVTVQSSTVRPFSLEEQQALPALARRYDLTWFTNYWVPLRWPGRFVVTVHDLIHLDHRFPASRLKRFLAARTFAKVRRSAAHVIFDSRFSARTFHAEVGIPAASSVVHLGIDHADQMVDTSTERREKIVLAVAAAKEHKNLPLLLDAWEEAVLADWKLVVVSPNDRLRSSIDLSERAGRQANVRLLRGVSDAELSRLYATAGFVVVPSRYEGFGFPLLEAMRAGAPVVSSTAESLIEVASGAPIPFVGPDDRDGWVRIMQAMTAECGPSSTWQQELSARSRAVADGFTWDRAGTATAAIVADALCGAKAQ